jgi:FtsZ-interacting cell division protein ZipA
MSSTTLAIVIAVAVVVILLIVFLVSRRSRARREEEHRERTREEFGSEYERTAEERGSEQDAEKELRERRGRVERQVEPLSEESRGRYEEQWGEVERVFVDNPERSIEMADRTVTDILGERKFVADASQSDEETERGLAAMHPEVADDYREARRTRASVVGRSAPGSEEGSGDGPSDESTEGTEELRQAIRHYRAVYEKILQG